MHLQRNQHLEEVVCQKQIPEDENASPIGQWSIEASRGELDTKKTFVNGL
jgi:hypothetical protein